MLAHAHAAHGPFWALALTWFGMMAAMMAPTAWPWVSAYHRFHHVDASGRLVATGQFASGYLLAWLGYAVAASLLQRVFQRFALMPSNDVAAPLLGAIILFGAGLYQFSTLKRACLAHCRTPLGYFLTRWIDGPMGAFRMGLHHGLFCVGCCWALMATAFAVGVMNVWWMVALAAVALLEQTAKDGGLLRRVLGCLFIAAGIVRLALT